MFEYNGEEKVQNKISRAVTEARQGIEGFEGIVPRPGADDYDPYWDGLLVEAGLTDLNDGKEVTITTTTWKGNDGITYYSADGPTRSTSKEVLLSVYKRRDDPTATNGDELWIGGIFQSVSLAAKLMGILRTSILNACNPKSATGVSGTYKNCGCHWRYASEKKEGEVKEKVEEE